MVKHPRLGEEWADCPHCGELNTFHEYPLHRGNTPDLPLLRHNQNGTYVHGAGQTCTGCHGVLLYLDNEPVFPYRELPNVRYRNLPLDLREAVLSAYQVKAHDSALAAAGLRRVLECMCVRAGMPEDESDSALYVAYLKERLHSIEALSLLADTCDSQERLARTNRIYKSDGDACVIALAELINQAGNELFGSVAT